MEKTGAPGCYPETESPGKYFEERLYESLSSLLKNVSEFLYSLEENVTFLNNGPPPHQIPPNYAEFEHRDPDIVPESIWLLFQIFTVTGIVWILNRYIAQSSRVQQWTEAVVAWILIVVSLPLLVPTMGAILATRTALALYFKFLKGGKIQLMNPFDAVWSFENPNSTSTCVGLYVIKGDGDLTKIRDLLRIRVLEKEDGNGERIYDRFQWNIVKIWGFMCWRKYTPNFDINEHIRHLEGSGKGSESFWTEQELFTQLGQLHDVSLNRSGKSPWEILIVPKFRLNGQAETSENHYAIVFRIHHSIADGISMGHILHQCIADEPFTFSVDPTSPLKFSKLTVVLSYLVAFILIPQITLRNLFFNETNAFHTEGMLTGPKSVNWSNPMSLSAVKELKDKSKTSVFAVLMACLTGAMRRLYKKHGHGVPEIIHACPPVAILPYPDRKPRNRFSVVLYPLATGKGDPVERLDAVFKASKTLASSPDVLSNFLVIYVLGLLPFALLKIIAPLAHATITFSNIPGPTEKVLVFNGDELVEIGAWIPIKNRIGIGMALFSYNDKLRVTIIADRACLSSSDDADLLRDYFETEMRTLAQVLEINNMDKLFT